MPFNPKFASTLYNPEYLRQRYVDDDLNASQLAKEIGCTPGAVLDALKTHGIPKKTMSGVLKKVPHPGSHAPRPRRQFIETLHNRPWLEERFVTRGMTASAIAREAGCSAQRAWEAIKDTLGVTSTTRSEATEDVKHGGRGRAAARRVFSEASPCIVCGDPKGTLNHIDADTHNNEDSNLEWLCMRHHLMVDKRLQGRAARWVREYFYEQWLEWHAEILTGVIADPNRTNRGPLFKSNTPEVEPTNPCALCGVLDSPPFYKDRNEANQSPDNLERLCGECAQLQRAMEEVVS